MTRRVELALWIVAVTLALAAGLRGRAASVALSTAALVGAPADSLRATPSVLTPQSAVLVAAADSFVARNPFRLDRKPSGVAYSPAMEGAPPPPPRPPRPTLAVAGIVGGPPWEALLDGIPGRQGSVLVKRGDTLGGLRVRVITRDTVRITGVDTTWTLTVRRTWQ